jgi:hypothetical protein
MRTRFRFPFLPWEFFLEGKDPHGDHGLGSLVEFRFKAPPGTSYSYITIHLIGTTSLRVMGVPTSEVGYTSVTAGRRDHEVHKGHVVALDGYFELDVICSTKHFKKNSYFHARLYSKH